MYEVFAVLDLFARGSSGVHTLAYIVPLGFVSLDRDHDKEWAV